jgi:hypothetical protein
MRKQSLYKILQYLQGCDHNKDLGWAGAIETLEYLLSLED